MGKTLNEIKNEFLRERQQFLTRAKFIEREILILQQEAKKLSKNRQTASNFAASFFRKIDDCEENAHRLNSSVDRLSRLIEPLENGESDDLPENVFELRPLKK